MTTNNETWIIYKTESGNSLGWENRKLMPSGGLTDILAEEWDWSGAMPQVGERVREYANLSDPGNGITHGKDGNWVVTGVDSFNSPTSPLKIVVCTCQFQPIGSEWQEIRRGKPISDEMLASSAKA